MSDLQTALMSFSFLLFIGVVGWLLWGATELPKDTKKLREVQDENRDLRARVAYLQTENRILRQELKVAKAVRRNRK